MANIVDDSAQFIIQIQPQGYNGGWDPTRYTYDSRGFTTGESNGGINFVYTVISTNPRIYQLSWYFYSWRFLVASNNVHAGGPAAGETIEIRGHMPESMGNFYQCDGGFCPWYTEDGLTFNRTNTTGQWVWDDPANHSLGGTYTFWFTMPAANYCQLSNFFPWDYWTNQAYTDTFNNLPFADVYNVCNSPHGRETRMVELTNFSIAESQKKHIAMICRTHPSESCSQLVVEGLMNHIRTQALQGNTDLIDKFHWYFVPVIEVDATLGQGMAGCGQSCNYHWGDDTVPVIAAIRDNVFDLANNGAGIDAVFDMHSQGGSCGWTGILYISGHPLSQNIANAIHAQNSRYDPSAALGTSGSSHLWDYAYNHYHINEGHCAGFASEVGQAQKSQSQDYIRTDGVAFANALMNVFYP